MSPRRLGSMLFAAISSFVLMVSQVSAVTLFSDDFETDRMNTPDPANDWSWQAPFDAVSNETGMMFGEGDMYSRSLAIKHSGKYSLRLNFQGRNNFCNVCFSGTQTYYMKSGINNATFFQEKNGTDLSASFPVLTDPQARVYNKSDNWALWQVDSVSTDTLNFVGNAPVQNDMGGDGDFDDGDEIKIVKTCDVVEKRSDCNLGINYLENIDSAADFPLGGSLSRRMYLYIPSSTDLPSTTLKLAYIFFHDTSRYSSVLALSIGRGTQLESHHQFHGEYHFTGLLLERDKWYYIEEIWTRETAAGNDGSYELYSHPVDNPVGTPLVSETGLHFGELKDVSTIGNWQHKNEVIGSIYIDDVAIKTGGLSGPTGNDTVPLAPVNADIN